jgi:hypothetical protein
MRTTPSGSGNTSPFAGKKRRGIWLCNISHNREKKLIVRHNKSNNKSGEKYAEKQLPEQVKVNKSLYNIDKMMDEYRNGT